MKVKALGCCGRLTRELKRQSVAGIEADRTSSAERDGPGSADRVDSGRDVERIAGDRILVREAEHDRHVGHVPLAGLREGAVEVYLDPDDGIEDPELLPAPDNPLSGPPRAKGVGARGPHTDLEHVERTDGSHRRDLP